MRLETQYRILQYGTRKFKLLSKVENVAYVVNLSAGGAALEINCPLQLAVVIGFRLDLGFDFLDIVGTVKWMQKESDEIFQVGVQFENIDDIDKKR